MVAAGDIAKELRNARMPRKKLSGICIFIISYWVNPASAFRHQGQSGAAGHGLVYPATGYLGAAPEGEEGEEEKDGEGERKKDDVEYRLHFD